MVIIWDMLGIIGLFVVLTLIVITVEDKDGESNLGWPLFWILVAGVIVYFLNKKILLEIDYYKLLISALIYLLLGLFWSFFKWYRFVKKAAKYFKKNMGEYQASFLRYEKELASYEKEDPGYRNREPKAPKQPNVADYIPKVSDNKAQLSSWIILFPFSVLRYALGNLLTDFLNGIIKAFKSVYETITKNLFKDFK